MTIEHGQAGKSTREKENKRYKNRVIVTLVGLGFAFLFFVLTQLIMPKHNFLAGALSLLVVVVVLKIMVNMVENEAYKIKRLEKRARKGAIGEETVADVLKELPDSYAVFHDIETPYGNIDHVAVNIENGKVFLIETKSHYGTVTHYGTEIRINGKVPEKDFTSQALKNTFWLKDELKNGYFCKTCYCVHKSFC